MNKKVVENHNSGFILLAKNLLIVQNLFYDFIVVYFLYNDNDCVRLFRNSRRWFT